MISGTLSKVADISGSEPEVASLSGTSRETTTKISIMGVVDNLETEDPYQVLSANQGVVLKNMINLTKDTLELEMVNMKEKLEEDDAEIIKNLENLIERFEKLADSDDIDLDQLSEVVEFIKNNKDLIDKLTTDTAEALEAAKTELNETIDAVKAELSEDAQNKADAADKALDEAKTELAEALDATKEELTEKIESTKSDLEIFTNTVLEDYSTTTQVNFLIEKTANEIKAAESETNAQMIVDLMADSKNKADSALISAKSYSEKLLQDYSTTTQMNFAISEATAAVEEDTQNKIDAAIITANQNTADTLKSYSTTDQMNSAIDTAKTEMATDAQNKADAAVASANSTLTEALKAYSTTEETGTIAGNAVVAHNASPTSHDDIRTTLTELSDRLNAIVNGEDVTLDQLNELVEFIKSNESLIDSITTSKVSVSDVVNDLESMSAKKPLAANQGRVLKGMIEDLDESSKSMYATKESVTQAIDTAKQNTAAALTPYSTTAQMNEAIAQKATEITSSADNTYATKTEVSQQVADTKTELSKDSTNKVAAHNVSPTAHDDLRTAIQDTARRLNTFADSDDETLDQLSEVVAYIKSNQPLFDAITLSKVSVSDIVDGLESMSTNKPLSANQGRILKGLIDDLESGAITQEDLDQLLATAESDAQNKADAALAEANQYTDQALTNYSTTEEMQKAIDDTKFELSEEDIENMFKPYSTTAQMNTAIAQKAAEITTNVDETYATKEEVVVADNSLKTLLTEITNRVNAIADSDDETLDQLSEIVAYIKSNRTLIDQITTSKVSVSDIVDNLTSNGVINKPLSANQGVVLDEKITALSNTEHSNYSSAMSALSNKVDKVSGKGLSTNDYTTTEKNKLAGIATGAEVNVQSDWSVTDTSSDAFIKSKPSLATVATSGSYNDLSNKPTIPDVSGKVNSANGAMTGILNITNGSTSELTGVRAKRTDKNKYIFFGMGNGGINRGVYDEETAKWLVYADSSNAVYLNGNATTATTATALSSSAGSATNPVYFSSGKPVACTYTLGKSVPSNAVFTDTVPTAVARLTCPDTRDTNSEPSYYRSYTGIVTEFKRRSSINSVPGSNTYAQVTTFCPYVDTSGGYPIQLSMSSDNNIYIRHATSNTAWGDWTKVGGDSVDTSAFALKSIYANNFISKSRTGDVGSSSIAFGELSVTASGQGSCAIGGYAKASGSTSFALGYNVQATGDYSHAEGRNSKATGDYSHAEGGINIDEDISAPIASGKYSHAEGSGTKAEGQNSHAEGEGTTATGNYSHAEGVNSITYSGSCHAEGADTKSGSSGNNVIYYMAAHAEGYYTTASGQASHAEGLNCIASALGSHAGGELCTAQGRDSFATGVGTIAGSNYQCVVGMYNLPKYNETSTVSLFTVGNGTSAASTNTSNAFRITNTGYIYGQKTSITSGADYAEYFEWADGNPNNEDRRGFFVTLDNKMIRKANSNDIYILGAVSANPAVLGNGDPNNWTNKFLKDDFDDFIMKPTPIQNLIGIDNDGNKIFEESEILSNVINPDYDESLEQDYVERKDRKEWSPIGMVGVLTVHDDGTCEINGYCKCNDEGIATAAGNLELEIVDGTIKKNYRVVERVNDHLVRVLIR